MMRVIHLPRSLLLSSSALFVLVPVAVLTRAVFSSHAWWDPPLAELALCGWATLGVVAPISWRLAMGRRGAWEMLAVVSVLVCGFLVLRSAWMGAAAQALWAVMTSALCVALLFWTRSELNRSYFNPNLSWFQGVPRAIPHLYAVILGLPEKARELRVSRLDEKGLFAFSLSGSITPSIDVELELRYGEPHEARRTRVKGSVVRQFEGRASKGDSGDWGIGVRFHPQNPDESKEFHDFLGALRGEGYIHE
ncbi:MAG: hypothetical protein KGQ59_02290 [Bdellovibrionales bacterium]|nr:hypothetical protein [Bdellovibrionales bacterium]